MPYRAMSTIIMVFIIWGRGWGWGGVDASDDTYMMGFHIVTWTFHPIKFRSSCMLEKRDEATCSPQTWAENCQQSSMLPPNHGYRSDFDIRIVLQNGQLYAIIEPVPTVKPSTIWLARQSIYDQTAHWEKNRVSALVHTCLCPQNFILLFRMFSPWLKFGYERSKDQSCLKHQNFFLIISQHLVDMERSAFAENLHVWL